MKLFQLSLLFLMLIASILAFGFPQFRTYILQTISLLTVFSIVLHHYQQRIDDQEKNLAVRQEQLILFVTTQLQPTLEEVDRLLDKKKVELAQEKINELQGGVHQLTKEHIQL